jgi:pyridoxamine 5'-phosphate oxidase
MRFEEITDPLDELDRLRAQALEKGLCLPEAMTLATVSASGLPHVRVVLLKERRQRRLVFFTNYESDKAVDLQCHPKAEVCVFYPDLEFQARISGTVAKIDAQASDEYFRTRPRESQLGAWASRQSRPLASREQLEEEFAEVQKRFSGLEVPRPAHWGDSL